MLILLLSSMLFWNEFSMLSRIINGMAFVQVLFFK